jgi:hypothetical protein
VGDNATTPPPGFQLLELDLIHKNNLLARARIAMPSGLVIACNVLRNKQNAELVFVMPVAERTQTGYRPVVDFATAAVRDAWQTAAVSALRPRWAELTQPAQSNEERFPRYDANF